MTRWAAGPLALALVAMAMGANIVRAEVRLQSRGLSPDVSVTRMREGIWSPAGTADSRTLNPRGDANGHGAPVWSQNGSRVLAAWPTADQVQLAIGGGGSWAPVLALDGQEALAGLSVVPLGESWCVAWQVATSGPETRVQLVTPAGDRSPVVRLESARLRSVRALSGDGIVVETQALGGGVLKTIMVVTYTSPGETFPVPLGRVPLADLLARRGVLTAIPALTLPGDGSVVRTIEPAPILIPTSNGWGLIWSEGSAPTTIRAKTVSADGRLGMPIDLAEGRIIGTTSAADGSTHVIFLRPDGQLTDIVTTFGIPTAPQPVDAPTIAQISDIERITDTVHADVRLNSLPTATVLTWWASPRELRFVELGTDGPLYPIRSFESRGATTYQQVLIRRALDEFSAK